MSHTKIRALQQWCKALVDGYKDVNITNMSSSWRDGLAFCALIHRFRPDLINFDALSKNNVYENNQLAFTVAESLGIAALLEAKDMNDLPVPDKLSIITYVASMHNYFKDKEKLGGPGVSSYKEGNIQIGTKRHQDNDPLNTTEPKRSTPDQSEEKIKKIGSSPTRQRSPADDLCALCQKKVYLIEKQIDNGKLYHRSCFRGSHMSPTSKILSRSFSNGATLNDSSVPEINRKMEQTANMATCENSKSLTKVRLYEKRKEQIQKAEEKLKAEKQRENELYEKRQNTPSALRNHLKNIDNETRETFKSSADSSTSHSQFFSKQTSPQRDLGKSHNTTEQPSWAQTKLRKTFNDSASSNPSALSLEKERSSLKDFSVSTEEKRSRESSPGSPVLMMQVTSRTMEDKQHRASKSVTKSSTSLEAESGKQQVVSGLLKSLANIRQRQDTAITPSPTSSPPPPKTPSGPPHFSKLSTAQSTSSPMPVVTNSLPFSQPLNSLPSTPAQALLKSTPLLDKTKDVKLLPPTDTHANQKDKSRSVARIKTVITSTPTNPATPLKTQPLTTELASTTSALSRNSNITNESASVPDSLTKPKASKKTTEVSPLCLVSSTKTNITSKNSPSHPASLSKSNVSKVDSQSSSSRSASPAKSKVSQITSESSSSRSASPAKSKVSQITSESSSSRSASPAKSKVSQITSESSSSRSASPAKSKVSQITSESSSSRSASPAKSKVSQITSESSSSRSASPAKSKVSQITSESSSSHSASPTKSKVSQITSESPPSQSVSSARSNLSKITAPPLQTDSPAKLALSKTTLVTSSGNTHTTDKLSMTKDNRPQSILERIEQYSKVAAGVEKPLSEQSPKREIILGNNDKQEDWQSSHKQNTFTTTSTTITPIDVRKPLASESTKEHNTVSRHIVSPSTPKKMDNKSETVCMPPAVVKTYDKNGQTSSKAEIIKEVKQPSYLTSKSQPDKSSVNECTSKRLPHIKQVEEDKNSSKKEVSTSACSIGLTKLHPAHYTPKLSDSSPKSTFETSKTAAVPTLDMRVNPIPKPKRQKPGLIPNTTRENKENPIESNLSHNNFTNSHKTNGALSERQDTGDTSKTEWQLEAERRMAARKGKYVDPETRITRFVLPDTTTQLENEKNGDGNQNRHGLKKISVTSNLTFNFDDSLNSNTSLDFPYRKQVLPKQDLDSLEWGNPKKQLSTDEIQRELMDIDSKLTDLELRGRQLEVSIRAASNSEARETSHWSECSKCWHFVFGQKRKANEEDEKFMVEWFQLINEKNELIRRENDLIYQSQEQELEEEQIQIDKELQALMQKPYEKKSKAEKRKEEELIQKKINVVNQRNLIVDSIDEDRLRYKEEDEGIKEVLQSKGYLGIEATY